eukprot:TRINITY_DN2609_c0_g1_i13.p1 TRINITY_DN2609_c0_g1~~TRINITY_DN2609_c0_g1_i13.p1  ORF type:complete len:313 (+),score=68.92 TRINITY_DN2609_c0_g1_i13:647-1585(+)
MITEDFLVSENLDPIDGLQSTTVADIAFFEFPPNLPPIADPFTIGPNPSDGDVTFVIGYNNTTEPSEIEEYRATLRSVPPMSDVVNAGRSVSLGKVVKSNNGIACIMSSTATGCSGGPQMTLNGQIFGIASACFYDVPDPAASPAPWTIQQETDITRCNITLPKALEVESSKNYNVVLCFSHSNIQQMLQQVDLPVISFDEICSKHSIPHVVVDNIVLVPCSDLDTILQTIEAGRILVSNCKWGHVENISDASGTIKPQFIVIGEKDFSDDITRASNRRQILLHENIQKAIIEQKNTLAATVTHLSLSLTWS